MMTTKNVRSSKKPTKMVGFFVILCLFLSQKLVCFFVTLRGVVKLLFFIGAAIWRVHCRVAKTFDYRIEFFIKHYVHPGLVTGGIFGGYHIGHVLHTCL